jgi:cytochrome bd-type quinol oxidase subunit 1
VRHRATPTSVGDLWPRLWESALVHPVELVVALVFLGLAVRSAVYWMRHRLQTEDTADEMLFALFVTGRVGTWLLASGLFFLYASITVRGQASEDDASRYEWLFIVFLLLGATQLIAAWFLGARGRRRDVPDTPEAEDEPRPPMP